MQLDLTATERAFRDEVRGFIAAELPDDLRGKLRDGRPLVRADYQRWQRLLHARGWGAGGWPAEHGGAGWTPVQRYLFDVETALGDAPFIPPFGLYRLGPVLYTHGTPAQRERFLPPLLDGTHWWCQGYSEAGAGSDLAALRTRARLLPGGDWELEGAKLWTSNAHWSDWMFCLARTRDGGKPQQGISFFLVPMDAPGLGVRPVPTFDGLHHVNEVLLDRVRVPADHLVGAEGQGWTLSRLLLGFERVQIAEVPQSQRLLARVQALAPPMQGMAGRRWRARLAEAAITLRAHELTTLRLLTAAGDDPGPLASMLKVVGADIRQALTRLALEALGPDTLPYEPGWLRQPDDAPGGSAPSLAAHYLYSRASSIYGGSNEIQRNILARQVLDL